ncbi:rhodanese-like domain-containing protein [Alcaligenaceae bacterium LF4-65]|uniref:Rhodanese-like domain-containing protein n=2 Tax=Zwartia hollandica TaxID=324606 RepID=A0A953N734_9BURK|nr:rhodanese-like domain-containing protein [Zwartia hollandica]
MIQRSRGGASVSSTQAVQMINHQGAVLLDVRSIEAFHGGHIPQARHAPLPDLEKKAASLAKDKPVILVCEMGRSAVGAATKLRALGFTAVSILDGGIKAWTTAGLPLTTK